MGANAFSLVAAREESPAGGECALQALEESRDLVDAEDESARRL